MEKYYVDATWTSGKSVIGYCNQSMTDKEYRVINCMNNNVAELEAAKLLIKAKGESVEILTDSQFVVTKLQDSGVHISHVPREKNLANVFVRAIKESLNSRK